MAMYIASVAIGGELFTCWPDDELSTSHHEITSAEIANAFMG